MTKFMKYHHLSITAFYNKIANTKPVKSKTSVDDRWKILLSKLNRKYVITGIGSILPDINRMKIKKITVKDKGQLQQNIREGRKRLKIDYWLESGRNAETYATSEEVNDPDFIENS